MEIKLHDVWGNGGGEYELSGGNEHLNLLNKPLVVEMFAGQRLNTYNLFEKQGGKIRLRLMKKNVKEVPLYKWIAAVLLLPEPKKVKLESPNEYRIKAIDFELTMVANDEIVIRLSTVEVSTLNNNRILDIDQRMNYVISLQDKLKNDTNFSQSNDFNFYYEALNSSNIYGSNGVIYTASNIRRNHSRIQSELLSLYYTPILAGVGDTQSADEVSKVLHNKIIEGAKKIVTVNSYERSTQAREICIRHYGPICTVCEFDFGKFYGTLGEGYIHVHHLIPITSIGQSYELDPISDLRPVCPNCHSMLHKKSDTEVFTIDELKLLISKAA